MSVSRLDEAVQAKKMWNTKQCVRCSYIGYSRSGFYRHTKKCNMMSSYKEHKGYEFLKRLLNEDKTKKIKSVWQYSDDQVSLRACVAKYKEERDLIKRKHRELETEGKEIMKLMELLNTVKEDSEEDGQSPRDMRNLKRASSRDGKQQQPEPPTKKARGSYVGSMFNVVGAVAG